jgi:DNA-binding NarL/FixJ family response regulator
MRVFERSTVPMLMVDSGRRYVEANTPARLAFRLTLAELRQLEIADLTPPYLLSVLDDAWARLMESGCVAGPYEVASPDGGRFEVTYYALADALPGLHLIVFAPAEWSDEELLGDIDPVADEYLPSLTPRELEVIALAADGRNGPMIARELFLSAATVRTHFANIYEKLDVGDRGAAVAKAMRLGLIA